MLIRTLEGSLDARNLRIGIVVSRFNEFITEQLTKGALARLEERGCPLENIQVVKVPGAWELPLAAKQLVSRGYHAVIALGAVVRGDTPHFDYVAGVTSDGLSRVSLETGVPIAFGVLTTDNMQQAMDRAGGKSGNKGAEAADVAVELANLLQELKKGG
jgi:6,7-dimethyl-8-ribityllumazine synthase